MKGPCLTNCGLDVDYEPIEFSDGFVYYFPRNLDKTVHDCLMLSQDVVHLMEDVEPDSGPLDSNITYYEMAYEENKNRTSLTFEQFSDYLNNYEINYILNSFDNDFGTDGFLVSMLIGGKMLDVKHSLESEMKSSPVPFYQSRRNIPGDPFFGDTGIRLGYQKEYSNVELAQQLYVKLPTKNGYQLEHLGLFYELMIRLEDAKKCYELQYECTGEPELLKKSKELDDKIKEMDKTRKVIENTPDNLTTEDIRKKIDSTELNIRKYVVSLFSNNFNELFRRNPSLVLDIQKIRKNDEESMIEVNENNDIETFSLGSIAYILKISKGQIKSDRHQTCSICGISWRQGEFIFLEKYPKKIICSDKICFQQQGGFTKSIPLSLIHRIKNISKTRNLHDHPRNYDKDMYEKMLKESYETCNVIDHFIERELTNMQST